MTLRYKLVQEVIATLIAYAMTPRGCLTNVNCILSLDDSVCGIGSRHFLAIAMRCLARYNVPLTSPLELPMGLAGQLSVLALTSSWPVQGLGLADLPICVEISSAIRSPIFSYSTWRMSLSSRQDCSLDEAMTHQPFLRHRYPLFQRYLLP